MGEDTETQVGPIFLEDLRKALSQLYNPAELRRSRLTKFLALENREDAAPVLRRILLDAIEALKPGEDIPVQSGEWRNYEVLVHRYAEQFMQREVAHTLGLSIRQLRRQETLALRELANYLWDHHQLGAKGTSRVNAAQHTVDKLSMVNPTTISREQELAWSQKAFPNESTAVEELFPSIIQTVDALAKMLRVHTVYAIPEHLPRLAVQVAPIRQALLSALTTAIRLAPGSHITVSAEAQLHEVCFQIIGALQDRRSIQLAQEHDEEGLEMARQLVGFSGGQLQLIWRQDRARSFVIHITLPIEDQPMVLAIDDNPDALALLQRYTSGTRYHLVGVRDPMQALTLAEELLPRIIMLDVMLPEIDGWELLGRFREHPKIGKVPIVVCTVLPEEELALALGASAFLRKPLSHNLFLTTLDAQLERNR